LIWNQQFVANDVSGQLYPIGIGNPPYLVDRDISGSPNILSNEVVGIIGKDGIYRAINRTTGETFWQTVVSSTAATLGNPSASFYNGVIYVAAISDIDPDCAYTVCPYPTIDYLAQIVGYGGYGGALKNPTSVLQLAKIFRGVITSKGILMALNAWNGNVIWSKIFPTAFTATPVYANGLVYIGSYDGTLRVLDAKTGDVKFSKIVTPAQAPVPTGLGYDLPLLPNLPILANVVVVNGQVFVPYSSMQFTGSGVLALGLSYQK